MRQHKDSRQSPAFALWLQVQQKGSNGSTTAVQGKEEQDKDDSSSREKSNKIEAANTPQNPPASALAPTQSKDQSARGVDHDISYRLSLYEPLKKDAGFNSQSSATRSLPEWMSLLPSNKTQLSKEHHASETAPLLGTEPTESSSLSSVTLGRPPSSRSSESSGELTPIAAFQTPLEQSSDTQPQWLRHQADEPTERDASRSKGYMPQPQGTSHHQSARPTHPERTPAAAPITSFPFFQNPKSPLSPSKESSWDTPRVLSPLDSAFEASLRSNEYNDKYCKVPHVDSPANGAICPICQETIDLGMPDHSTQSHEQRHSTNGTQPFQLSRVPTALLPPGVLAPPSVGHLYHSICIRCRACRLAFDPSRERIRSWVFLGAGSPYHRTCVVEGAGPMLDRLRNRISPSNISKDAAVYESMKKDESRLERKREREQKEAELMLERERAEEQAARAPAASNERKNGIMKETSPRAKEQPTTHGGRPRASISSLVLSRRVTDEPGISQQTLTQKHNTKQAMVYTPVPEEDHISNTSDITLRKQKSAGKELAKQPPQRRASSKQPLNEQDLASASTQQHPQDPGHLTTESTISTLKLTPSINASVTGSEAQGQDAIGRPNRRHTRPHNREERKERLARAARHAQEHDQSIEKARSPFGWGEYEEVGVSNDRLTASTDRSKMGRESRRAAW